MLELLELTTNCKHLSPGMAGEEYSRISEAKAGCKPTNSTPKIAIIAVGNPLRDEDSAALALIPLIRRKIADDRYCTFNFDYGFAWLKQVLVNHDRVIFIDSMLDSAGTPEGILTSVITNEVLDNSGLAIKASHGLSWLDEIKMIGEELRGNPMFLGIDGHKYQACNKMQRADLLGRALSALQSLLECRDTKGGQPDA